MPPRQPPTRDPEAPGSETRADFALFEVGPDAIERYWKLATETSQRLGGGWFYQDEARWAVRSLEEQSTLEGIGELICRWKEWEEEFHSIAARSPKWRLKCMISAISETHMFLSWPQRWEREVWNWAMAAPGAGCPFDDRNGVIDEEFRQRLRQAAEEAGGFLYRCEESRQVQFAPTDDLDRIWRHQDHLAAIDRDKAFGFFHDVSRPNFEMRPLTAEEEEMSAARQRRAFRMGWRSRVTRLLGWLSR